MIVYKFGVRVFILTIGLILTACQPQMLSSFPPNIEAQTVVPSTTVTGTKIPVLLLTTTQIPSLVPTITPSSLVELVPFDFGAPLPGDFIIDVYKMGRPVYAEETGFEQVLEALKTQSRWPGWPVAPRKDLQANNASLSPFGCRLDEDGVDELHPLSLNCDGKKMLGDIDLVSPVRVNHLKNDFIITVDQAHRGVMVVRRHSIEPVVNPDDWSVPTAQFLGDSEIEAITSLNPNNKVTISVYSDGMILDKIQAEPKLQKPLVGLWTYDNHWALEITDHIIIDGQSINDSYGYKSSFDFHVLGSKPLYFYEKEGKIGLNFDGQEINMNGYIVPHGNCCSESLLNPRQNGNVLIFFMNKDSQWYYIEAEVSSKKAVEPAE